MKARKSGRIEFSDAPMFNRVMTANPDICEGVVEAILGFDVELLGDPVAESTIEPRLGSKGVRLDVRAESTGKVYDIEMQTVVKEDLRRRARYYQAAMDVQRLEKGGDYLSLPESYVIFICVDDALGLGMPKASFSMFEESRREDGLHDGRHVVFLAASMYNQEESRRLRDLLRYVSGTQKEGSTDLVRSISSKVDALNEDEEEMMYLTKEQEDLILVREIERRDAKLAEKDAEIDRRDSEIEAQKAEIERLKAELAKKDRS